MQKYDMQPYIDHDTKANVEARNHLECILNELYGFRLDETVHPHYLDNDFPYNHRKCYG